MDSHLGRRHALRRDVRAHSACQAALVDHGPWRPCAHGGFDLDQSSRVADAAVLAMAFGPPMSDYQA